jgi:hypothetical protein
MKSEAVSEAVDHAVKVIMPQEAGDTPPWRRGPKRWWGYLWVIADRLMEVGYTLASIPGLVLIGAVYEFHIGRIGWEPVGVCLGILIGGRVATTYSQGASLGQVIRAANGGTPK